MKFSLLFLWAAMAAASFAQSAPSQPVAQTAPSAASSAQVNALLQQVEETAQSMQSNLSAMRVDRWKTDAGTRRSTQEDVDSLQRNLKDALPEITGQLRNAPESLPATFKLYRNLDALYDVFSSVTESAGAFGSKDDYQALANDLSDLEKNRRSLAERMDTLSTSKESEITALHVQLHDAQAALAAVPPPPKKIVDDDQPVPAPKPVKKKPKVPKPPSSTPTQTQSQPANSQAGSQSTQSQTQPH
ncbi:MAG TPA: hypothetical protein VF753_07225 [Terriglobales bacterium]